MHGYDGVGREVKCKVLHVFDQFSAKPWRRMGEWRHRFAVPDLGTRWRWVVSFMSRPLYPQRKIPSPPRCSVDRRLGGLQSRSWHCAQKSCLCHPTRSPPLYWLSYPDSHVGIKEAIFKFYGNMLPKDLSGVEWNFRTYSDRNKPFCNNGVLSNVPSDLAVLLALFRDVQSLNLCPDIQHRDYCYHGFPQTYVNYGIVSYNRLYLRMKSPFTNHRPYLRCITRGLERPTENRPQLHKLAVNVLSGNV
jgi:hypothetical protein